MPYEQSYVIFAGLDEGVYKGRGEALKAGDVRAPKGNRLQGQGAGLC